MKLSEIKTVFDGPLSVIRGKLPHLRIYIFGSVLNQTGICEDVDMLVIYKTPEDVSIFAEVFADASTKLPLHFICMTDTEEKELGFIDQQQAIDIQLALASCPSSSTNG